MLSLVSNGADQLGTTESRKADRQMTNVSLTIEARRIIRNAANASRSNLPVKVVAGSSEPLECGRSWHYETKGGSYIRHPSAYSKFGWSNMVYCSSTRRIEVGHDWLVAQGLIAGEQLAA